MTTLTVPADVFDSLASGGGDTRGVLRAGQRSKRLLLLHELISTARSRVPKLFAEARVEETYALLVDAQRHSRHRVDEVLMYPHVGAWATHCLRGLLQDGQLAPEDIGHLGAVTAAAALRAGLPCEVTAHLREETITFPTYGQARLPGARGWCRVRSRPGTSGVEISASTITAEIRFDASARPPVTWLPLRHLRSSAQGLTIDVALDDLDPYRDCGHLPIEARLSRAAVDEWHAKLGEAWSLLAEDHRMQAEGIAREVASLVPLRPSPTGDPMSGSCHDAIGAIAATPPETDLVLALAFIHELQHTKLSALLDLVPLLSRSSQALFYAPWRSDPRPLRGLLQGAYAFLGLTGFWEVHRRARHPQGSPAAELAHFEFAMGRRQVRRALDVLRGGTQLTPSGTRFLHAMDRRLSVLDRLPVPSVPHSLARSACLDHMISWRLRNIRPDGGRIATWAADWLIGKPCEWPGEPSVAVVDGASPLPSDARLRLIRRRLGAPDRWRRDRAGTTDADVLLVAGERTEAAVAYRAQISRTPDDGAAWAGLALARLRSPSNTTWALATFPEVVRALHLAIRDRCGRAPDPEDVAEWIAAGAQP